MDLRRTEKRSAEGVGSEVARLLRAPAVLPDTDGALVVEAVIRRETGVGILSAERVVPLTPPAVTDHARRCEALLDQFFGGRTVLRI